jgi:hypothetical protein
LIKGALDTIPCRSIKPAGAAIGSRWRSKLRRASLLFPVLLRDDLGPLEQRLVGEAGIRTFNERFAGLTVSIGWSAVSSAVGMK